ncbi:hypothetical protein [Clostridium sp. AM58-1XD]|uniref:hypothetical protein n=1 Tax=Clostridium sp. AM58-1XD TaxID=2292307 RepID=UPI0015F39E89|nr:hypothetical protein [Clostridium sp. AM58-1XD]
MISEITKNIIIRALKIRQERGENPESVIKNYRKLTEEEKQEILEEIKYRSA